ncbi:22276_t:CDS:2 [Racocetra persica]|uniref:22276_t:CDS:1 n=1 Tax=Racocetra persica TaxID=160502 RepID=A0ACA9KY50_9GLOM|nr:22276_t:CDS:2 [Racocetra persica]
MTKKNLGSCFVCNCQIRPNQYHRITEYALRKAKEKETFNRYNYLEVGKQLCYPYYLEIVEPDCYNESSTNNNRQDHIIIRKLLSFGKKITLMTRVLYKKQRKENNTLELNPDRFQTMLGDAEPQLVGFFDKLYNAFILARRLVNNYSLEIGLYLVVSGAFCDAINAIHNAENIRKYFAEKVKESQNSEETEEDTEKHEFIQKRDRDVLKLQNALEDIDKW